MDIAHRAIAADLRKFLSNKGYILYVLTDARLKIVPMDTPFKPTQVS